MLGYAPCEDCDAPPAFGRQDLRSPLHHKQLANGAFNGYGYTVGTLLVCICLSL